MARHRRGYFPSACAKKLLALRPARPEASACKSADRFCPSLQGSRNASWTGATTQAGRNAIFSDGGPLYLLVKKPVEPCHVAFGGFLSANLSRQTKTGGFHAGLHIPGMEIPWVPVWPKGRLYTFLATWMPDGQERTFIPDKTLRSGWGGLTNLSRARPFSSPLPLKWRRKV